MVFNRGDHVKYIFITGGVMSGLGKGITAASVGRILKNRGYKVTAVKIDPYLNIDAGTMNPAQHGEVFVLKDGSEVDLDLGNYERFLDIELYGFAQYHHRQGVPHGHRQGTPGRFPGRDRPDHSPHHRPDQGLYPAGG